MFISKLAIFAAFWVIVRSQLESDCRHDICQLPDCRCFSTEIPGNLNSNDIPQVILLTFDDAVTAQHYNQFYQFLSRFYNPHGCQIKATFFLSHAFTNYSLVNELYHEGFEIATHSITDRTDPNFWLNANQTIWYKEQIGMRDMLEYFANIPADQIVGSRAPYLLQGGNEMFQTLRDNNIRWDSSWPTRTYTNPGLWPYTLDYRSIQDCPVGRCPDQSFPGTWVVPMISLNDTRGKHCTMLDTCDLGSTNVSVFRTLEDNLKTHYDGNRSPFGLFLHSGWLLNTANMQGLTMFMESLAHYDDVYVLSISQLIEWVRHPVPKVDISDFTPWGCQAASETRNCTSVHCSYPPELTPTGSSMSMTICNQQCPPTYPWFDNIYGEDQ